MNKVNRAENGYRTLAAFFYLYRMSSKGSGERIPVATFCDRRLRQESDLIL